MNFAEAWAHLLAGGRIRRASWGKGFWWFMSNGKLAERTDSKDADDRFLQVTGATDDELLATDWEQA